VIVVRFFVLIFGFYVALANYCVAKTIELHRGIGTDIWVSWPGEAELKADPSLVETFPEWRKEIGPKQISHLREAGFDFVRLTIDPMAYVWEATVEKTTKLNANVLKAVQLFRDQGLNVLVDFHAIPTGGYRKYGTETYVANEKSFEVFVMQSASLAKSLDGQDPAHIAFETMNEPLLDCEYDEGGNTHRWRTMALQLHAAARAAAPKLTLVMQGSCWGGAEGLADLDPAKFKDDNIIWDFHSYEPFMFTHQGAEWTTGPEHYISGLHFPPQPSQKQAIIAQTLARIKKTDLSADKKKQLQEETEYNLTQYFESGGAFKQHAAAFNKVEAWAKQHKVPANQILLGEFGANRTDETAKPLFDDRLAFVEKSRREAEKRGYAWSFWDWSGSMSPTNNDQDRVVLPSYIKALGLTPRN
jgi:endoglucanase